MIAQELEVIGTELVVDEYESYISQSPIPTDCFPLTWWLHDEQQESFPRSSKMAADILSIPAMSADPKRTFSGRNVRFYGIERSLEHQRLKGGVPKSWIRCGIAAGLPAEEIEQYGSTSRDGSASDSVGLAENMDPRRHFPYGNI